MGRRRAYLPPEQRAELVDVLDEIEAAGLTLRKVWEAFRNGAAASQTESKELGEAITELIKTKAAANRRPAYVTSLEQYFVGAAHHRGGRAAQAQAAQGTKTVAADYCRACSAVLLR